ncbi:hypothetical protein MPC4_10239 [Methylocella tundrae]|uniref:Uncharacterized protein n=1 Tax=Methylocella tundrae TaxID=227605 RepID=A0A8B6M1D9_METTU|nr:hypothetical protein MPC4_10239 [Methylocella tundrae]
MWRASVRLARFSCLNESFGTLQSNRGIQQGYGAAVRLAASRSHNTGPRGGAPPRPASGRHGVRVRREPRRA